MENNLEINIMEILEKMKARVAEDAQRIALLEATVDVYSSKVEDLTKQLQLAKEIQNQ